MGREACESSESTQMLFARMGVVLLISAIFAAMLAGVVHMTGKFDRDGLCRLSSQTACLRP